MRFRELGIVTQRQAPRNARTVGEGLLYRAGYLGADGKPSALGMQALDCLRGSASPEQLPKFLAGLPFPVVEAEDSGVHHHFYLTERGSIPLVRCLSCEYCSPVETSQVRAKSSPTEDPLPTERIGTPGCSTIEALAKFLDVPKEKTAKAILLTRIEDGSFVFVVVRGDRQASATKLARLIGPTRLATVHEIQASGAVPGYASPIGLKQGMVIVDELAAGSANLVAGANEAGFHMKNVNLGRDYTAGIVADVVTGEAGDLCPRCGHELVLSAAESIGEPAAVAWEILLMALADLFHDERGLALPPAAAPFQAHLMQLPSKELDTGAEAQALYQALENASISVLFDDRDLRAGVKFADADLIGMPFRVVVGEKSLRDGMVELKPRRASTASLIPKDALVNELRRSSPQ
jgi:prolyl-tRNA synthetase